MQFLHSMIRTSKEKEAIEFYCNFLGMKLGDRIRLEDCYLQYLKDEKTNVEIELTINDENPIGGYEQGDNFGHFAFLCESLDEAENKMKKMGYSWEVEPFYMDEIKTRIAFLNDPDGNSIELIEKNNYLKY